MIPAMSKGHGEHTKDAHNSVGLPGAFTRPIKITMIGAGSGFTPRLLSDVLGIPGADAGEIALVDIDQHRLDIMTQLVRRLVTQSGRESTWTVVASTNRRDVLAGSTYVVNTIEVSGLDCVQFDNDIPLKYGVDQCIGDTIGPGGLFKALRTIPAWLAILKDVEELCPSAMVLNYTNPMNMLMLAAGRTTNLHMVGLCHSVQGTSELLARRAGVPYAEMEWECAGINHMAWFTKLMHKGENLYPRLIERARLDLAGTPADPHDPGDLVRKDMMLQFGAFITESSGHLSEYLPYYRKRKDLMAKYTRPGYDGESRFYASNWPHWREAADQDRELMLRGERPMKWERSWEYASWIIEAREKNAPITIYGNVMNQHRGGGPLISNLMHDGCVEVACLIDRNGIQPTVYGKLAPQMAALCDANMRLFDLGVTAAIERSKEAAIHALMLDPLTSAVCSPAEIRSMTIEMFDAEAQYLPDFR